MIAINLYNHHIMNILRLLPVLGLILLASCLRSPLSDVEITDPRIIRVEAFIYYKDDNNKINKDIYVLITDKNHQSVKLKNGYVRMNAKELQLDEDLGGYTYQYPGNSDEVGPGTYRFEVELPDSSTYEGSISYKAPVPEGLANLPNSAPAGRDMEISWGKAPPGWSLEVKYRIDLRKDVKDYGYNINGNIPTGLNSSHRFPSGSFYDKKGQVAVKNLVINAVYTYEGEMDDRFLSGSSVEAIYSFRKTVRVTD